VLVEQFAEVTTRVLNTTVGVVDQTVFWSASQDRKFNLPPACPDSQPTLLVAG